MALASRTARAYVGPLSILATLGSLWIWLIAVERFHIDTSGPAAYVTHLMWVIYLFAVPLAYVITILASAVGLHRRRLPRLAAVLTFTFAVAALAFWWWSITRMEV